MSENLKPKVSIVIPCRNEEDYIVKCLDAICNQSYGMENIEVFVCDGYSDDKTIPLVKAYCERYENIHLVMNEKKAAPSGMNLGIKASTGDIIIIFGAHSYMDKDYVKNSVEKLQSTEAACVGGKINSISENQSAEVISKAMSSPFGVGNALFRYSEEEMYVDTVAFGAYKREVLDDVGLFDEELVRNQDDELNYRITKRGYKILLSPAIKSSYYTRGSFKKLWRQYFQYGFWKVRVIQKHKKPASIRHLVPIIFVLSLIGGLIGGIFSPIIRWGLALELLLYLALATNFAFKVSSDKLSDVPRIILSFFILHCSYGLGFLEGIFKFYIVKGKTGVEKNIRSSR